MPVHDWQFWIVTIAMAGSAIVLLKTFVPRRGGSACPGCASGSAACAAKPEIVKLGGRLSS